MRRHKPPHRVGRELPQHPSSHFGGSEHPGVTLTTGTVSAHTYKNKVIRFTTCTYQKQDSSE